MRHSNKEIWTVTLGIVTVFIVTLAASMVPEFRRYLKIRSM